MGTLTLTLTIPDTKVASARVAFLARHPKPTEGPGSGLSDKQWFERWISAKLNREIQLGKRLLDTPPPDSTDYFTP